MFKKIGIIYLTMAVALIAITASVVTAEPSRETGNSADPAVSSDGRVLYHYHCNETSERRQWIHYGTHSEIGRWVEAKRKSNGEYESWFEACFSHLVDSPAPTATSTPAPTATPIPVSDETSIDIRKLIQVLLSALDENGQINTNKLVQILLKLYQS